MQNLWHLQSHLEFFTLTGPTKEQIVTSLDFRYNYTIDTLNMHQVKACVHTHSYVQEAPFHKV